MLNSQELESHEIVNEIWDVYDKQHQGFLNIKQSKQLVSDIMAHKNLQKRKSLINLMVQEIDENKNGQIEKEEFEGFFKNFLTGEEEKEQQLIQEIWKQYDNEDKSYISH